jgi:hypothetical protein
VAAVPSGLSLNQLRIIKRIICPQALGSLFVAWYDSQGYGAGILTHLNTVTYTEGGEGY